MSVFLASCTECGPVHVSTSEITLIVCNQPELSHYSFKCPVCHATVVHVATDPAIAVLLDGGLKPTMWEVPAEAVEAKTGPKLSYDDLLDFALQLGMTDLLSAEAEASAAAEQR